MCSGYRVVSRRRKGSYKLGGKVVKGEFYSRWGSELLPSTPLILLFLSFSLSLSLSFLCIFYTNFLSVFASITHLRVTFRDVRREDSGLRRHRTLYVVTAVITTDYILLRDLLLQRLHPFSGQVVANLHT